MADFEVFVGDEAHRTSGVTITGRQLVFNVNPGRCVPDDVTTVKIIKAC